MIVNSAERIATDTSTPPLPAGTLWQRVIDQTQEAIACGALQSIPTEYEFVEQEGIPFLVRVTANLARKAAATQQQTQAAQEGKDFNPFLPYDERMWVADLSATHVCLLNKYNVVDHHLLIVTRAFEAQETLLNLQDFAALGVCLAEIDGLGFYNGGKAAGASQRHKHVQLVPLPLAPEGVNLPIEAAIATAEFDEGIGRSPKLPFVHAIARLDTDSQSFPAIALERYQQLLHAVGIEGQNVNGDLHQSGAYNLLVTRNWMLVVPRTQDSFESISVNSLGFAGGLLARNPAQLQHIRELQPLTILSQVSYPLP